jgi:hypothetical protein
MCAIMVLLVSVFLALSLKAALAELKNLSSVPPSMSKLEGYEHTLMDVTYSVPRGWVNE